MEPLNEEIRKLSEPNCLTRLMVNRPCLLISISYILMIGVSAFVFYMGWLMPNNPNDRDYLVWGDKYVTDHDMSKLVRQELVIADSDDQSPL